MSDVFELFPALLSKHPVVSFLWWVICVCCLALVLTRLVATLSSIACAAYRHMEEASKWHTTFVQAISWMIRVGIWVAVICVIASRVNVPPVILAATGTVFGAALGFGSQESIRDVLKGTINLLERQFAIGDWVTLTVGGVDYMGQIKEITLRTVTIASPNDGDVTIPQGMITVVKNFSTHRGMFVVTVPLSFSQDVDESLGIFNSVIEHINNGVFDSQELLTDADIRALEAMDECFVRGVSNFDYGYNIEVVGYAVGGKQFAAKRAVSKILALALSQAGVELTSPTLFGMEAKR